MLKNERRVIYAEIFFFFRTKFTGTGMTSWSYFEKDF